MFLSLPPERVSWDSISDNGSFASFSRSFEFSKDIDTGCLLFEAEASDSLWMSYLDLEFGFEFIFLIKYYNFEFG